VAPPFPDSHGVMQRRDPRCRRHCSWCKRAADDRPRGRRSAASAPPAWAATPAMLDDAAGPDDTGEHESTAAESPTLSQSRDGAPTWSPVPPAPSEASPLWSLPLRAPVWVRACRRSLTPSRSWVATRWFAGRDGRSGSANTSFAIERGSGHKTQNLWPDSQESPGNLATTGHRKRHLTASKVLETGRIRAQRAPGSHPGGRRFEPG
jgi:hypothetical protein